MYDKSGRDTLVVQRCSKSASVFLWSEVIVLADTLTTWSGRGSIVLFGCFGLQSSSSRAVLPPFHRY